MHRCIGVQIGAGSLLEKGKEGKNMRRVTVLLATIAVMVTLFAVAAYAATVNGTANRDVLTESNRNDTINARSGDDQLWANGWSGETDELYGEKGRDYLNAADGDTLDTLDGGRGYDVCDGDVGDKFVSCEQIQ